MWPTLRWKPAREQSTKMPQKHINEFFSPSNLPPIKRKREGEPPDVRDRKKQKSAEPTARLVERKRIKTSDQNYKVKRMKLSGTREKMERAVEDRNERLNERCNQNKTLDSPSGMSLEVIYVNSLVDPGRLSRMKAIAKQLANDVTVMVDTRIKIQKALQMRSKDYVILATNKPFRGIAMRVHKRLEPEVVETDEENANYLAIIINSGGKKIGIIGIYGPNNDDPKFYRETLNKVLTVLVLKSDELIITGDFNISISDSVGYMGRGSYKKEALAECIKIWNLKDVVEFKAGKCDIKPQTYIHTTRNESANKDIYPLKAARLDGIYTTVDPSGV